MTIMYALQVEIRGVLINLETKEGEYSNFLLARIKTGKDGASQVTVTLGRRFLDVVTEDDLGREIYVQATMNTQGDRDQYHRFNGSLVYWCDEFDENGNRTTK